jgi:hypothetical protein
MNESKIAALKNLRDFTGELTLEQASKLSKLLDELTAAVRRDTAVKVFVITCDDRVAVIGDTDRREDDLRFEANEKLREMLKDEGAAACLIHSEEIEVMK